MGHRTWLGEGQGVLDRLGVPRKWKGAGWGLPAGPHTWQEAGPGVVGQLGAPCKWKGAGLEGWGWLGQR